MFRRDVFEMVGGYDESYIVAQDINLFLRMKHTGFYGEVIGGFEHSHTFSKDISNTYKRNRESRLNAMWSRVLYLRLNEKLNHIFIIALIKDIIFLLLPINIISSIKFFKRVS